MIDSKLKNYLIKQLDEAEEYTTKVFLYLKELELDNPKDLRLQEEIWNLCEAGEIVSNTVVELECLDDQQSKREKLTQKEKTNFSF